MEERIGLEKIKIMLRFEEVLILIVMEERIGYLTPFLGIELCQLVLILIVMEERIGSSLLMQVATGPLS